MQRLDVGSQLQLFRGAQLLWRALEQPERSKKARNAFAARKEPVDQRRACTTARSEAATSSSAGVDVAWQVLADPLTCARDDALDQRFLFCWGHECCDAVVAQRHGGAQRSTSRLSPPGGRTRAWLPAKHGPSSSVYCQVI